MPASGPPAEIAITQGDATSFRAAFAAVRSERADFLAAGLFRECFRAPFPVPPALDAQRWHQYVAFYRWPDQRLEVVGFCNWIRYDDVYLEGGMCVAPGFYRRLPKPHFRECSRLGGVAQLMMESAARQLDDCAAWFGYCGDRKAMIVDTRFGYVPTAFPHLIVKWFGTQPEAERERLIARIAALGPF